MTILRTTDTEALAALQRLVLDLRPSRSCSTSGRSRTWSTSGRSRSSRSPAACASWGTRWSPEAHDLPEA